MSFKKLQEFIEMAKAAGVTELKYKDGDKEFEICFPSEESFPTYQKLTPSLSSEVTSKPATEASTNDNGLVSITSPFVGTFYGASSPDSPPYVKVGDRIGEGKALCIIEAMKIMNEIESDISGEIVEICVENENYVEYGEVLFKVRP